MTEIPVMRLTDEALGKLRDLAREIPEVWSDSNTDFEAILKSHGCSRIFETTGITFNNETFYAVDSTLSRPSNADILADTFYSEVVGMTPELACSPGIWEYFTHFHLHQFCLDRFPKLKSSDSTPLILEHFFAENKHRQLHTMNPASRLWWLAHTAHRAANSSEGAYQPYDVIKYFANHAQHYHLITDRELFNNDMILSEFLGSLLHVDGGINNAGVHELWRSLNIIGGSLMLDALSREEVRNTISDLIGEVMSRPPLVSGRQALRNPDGIIRVLSLGAGVQSSVLALMSDRGEYGIDKPDFAVFADTGWEPPAVYEHLEWLKSQLSFEVVTVSAGNILSNVMNGVSTDGHKFLVIPAFTVNPDGTKGRLVRQCTSEYKIVPIHSYLRERLGLQKGQRAPKNVGVRMILGISIDEADRIKPSRFEWVTHEYPLVDRDFSRIQLHQWFNNNYPGRKLPKSACIGCPYHSNAIWGQMKHEDPDSFQQAVALDSALRNSTRVRGAVRGCLLYTSPSPRD